MRIGFIYLSLLFICCYGKKDQPPFDEIFRSNVEVPAKVYERDSIALFAVLKSTMVNHEGSFYMTENIDSTEIIGKDYMLLPIRGGIISVDKHNEGSLRDSYPNSLTICPSKNKGVYSCMDGLVANVFDADGGALVIIRTDLLFISYHLAISIVKKGQIVKKGAKIGELGEEGNEELPSCLGYYLDDLSNSRRKIESTVLYTNCRIN
ncbi:MAG: peptidoglycan DD-metalloendopeptidase family protein [Chitinophagaceae bacterium]